MVSSGGLKGRRVLRAVLNKHVLRETQKPSLNEMQKPSLKNKNCIFLEQLVCSLYVV